MLKTTIFSTLLAFSLLTQGCSKEKNNNSQESSPSSSANSIMSHNSNEYVLTGLDNKQYVVTKTTNGYTLEGATGKVVIFDIFATWCPPCRATAPHLSALKKKYKDDLIVIGVTIEENLPNQKLQEFREKYGANYVLVNSTQNRRLVNAMATSLELGNNFPIPIMAIFKDGKLIQHYLGMVEEEFVESDIKRSLGK